MWQPMRELVSRGADAASLRGRAIIFHRTKIICERSGGKTSPRGVLDVPKGPSVVRGIVGSSRQAVGSSSTVFT